MIAAVHIVPIGDVPHEPAAVLQSLAEEAAAEGYNHVARLAQEWAAGDPALRVVLCALSEDDTPLAIGALTSDPYEPSADTERLRRFYVRPVVRRYGVGKALVAALLARSAARQLTLRAPDTRAAIFWEAVGFTPDGGSHRTHSLTRMRSS